MFQPQSSTLVLLLALSASAEAQSLPVAFVSDSTNDAVYRLADTSFDGDYNDVGEITVFYDDVLGAVPLQTNIGAEIGPGGVLLVCDSGADEIFILQDLNADDDALDAGEITTFFDGNPGGNLSGVPMSSAQDMCWDNANGILWVINAGTSGNPDSIIRLQDTTADGDANDLGEAVEYYLPAPGGAGGDSVPQDLALGAGGELYYLEAGATGVLQKGVYRLNDLDLSGTIDQPGEVTAFYTPMDLQSGFPTHLMLASDGFWYMSDQLLDNVRRFRDTNTNGVIDAGSEDSVWYASAASSIIWEINQATDGVFYAVESQTPDRLLQLQDLDLSGSIDQPNEVVEVYDDTLADLAIGNPRGLALEPSLPSNVFADSCSGDGGDQMGCTNCPCANNSPIGTVGGCLNSALTSAVITATGSASVSLPTGATVDLRISLAGSPPNAFCILNSGDAVAPGNMANPCFGMSSGAQAAAFDGLRCAITNTRRHGGRSADGNGEVGVTNTPWGGEGGPPVGLAVAGGGFASGQTRFFQVINRDDPMAVCMRGLNTSQTVEVTFAP